MKEDYLIGNGNYQSIEKTLCGINIKCYRKTEMTKLKEDEIYLVGDIRYTENAVEIYESCEHPSKPFLLDLQKLMEEYGVVKIDVSIDPIKYHDKA